MGKVALVLEGGGMRGAYTAGVIDCLIENKIIMDACYGVSAGAINACSYVSSQKGRSFDLITHQVKKKKIGSLRKLFKTGNYLDNDFIYDFLPNVVYPLDKETFMNSKTKMVVVLTNVETGEAEYHHIEDLDKQMIYVRASASLPIVSRFVPINDNWYLDGGLADSIPVKRALDDGYDKCVVVLTRQRGYVKKKSSSFNIVRIKYRHYPNLVKCIKNRHNVYNDTLAYLNEQEEKGKCFIIQPKEPVKVKRLETDNEKINDLYKDGYEDTLSLIENLKEFIK